MRHILRVNLGSISSHVQVIFPEPACAQLQQFLVWLSCVPALCTNGVLQVSVKPLFWIQFGL
jgi:hypothetical protein